MRTAFGVSALIIQVMLPLLLRAQGSAPTTIDCSETHNLVIRPDGTLWGWETPSYQSDSLRQVMLKPVQLSPDRNWCSVALIGKEALLLKTDGTLWSWQGNRTAAPLGAGRRWSSIAAGGTIALAVSEDHTLWEWRNRPDAQGIGKQVSTPVSNPLNALQNRMRWQQAVVTNNTIYSVAIDGSLWQWDGYDTWVLTRVGRATDWQTLSAGPDYVLAIRRNGTLWGWGQNIYGQLGEPVAQYPYPNISGDAPRQIGTATTWRQVAAGKGSHAVGLQQDGTLWAWGQNTYGQLGAARYYHTAIASAPTQVGTAHDWVNIAAHKQHSLGQRADGSVWGWGAYEREVSMVAADTLGRIFPVGSPAVVQLAAGAEFSAVIRADGSLWTWGSNSSGQLGQGNYQSNDQPRAIDASCDWAQVSAAGEQVLAIKRNGSLWAWGASFGRQAEPGISELPATPQAVDAARDWKMVFAVGSSSAFGLKTDGSLWTWEQGSSPPTTSPSRNYRRPLPVGKGQRWLSVSGSSHLLALRADGSLWGWGRNGFGNLGLPPKSKEISADNLRLVAADKKWRTVTTGGLHTVGLDANGIIWTWGFNGDCYTLGRPTLDNSREGMDAKPGLLPTKLRWRSIAATGCVSAAVATDGSIWHWGDPRQVGMSDGSTGGQVVLLGAGHNWQRVVLGGHHGLALRADGSLWSWGSNARGQLGRPISSATPPAYSMRRIL